MPRVKIVFLGTGGTAPTKKRLCTGVYIEYFGEGFLLDCPECVQRAMVFNKIPPLRVNRIFLSHIHGDHIFGLPGLLHTMNFQDRKNPLQIYIPKKHVRKIKEFILSVSPEFSFDLQLRAVKEGVIVDEQKYSVLAFPLDHTTECFGYVFEERSFMRANKDKLMRFGLLNSPLVGLLKKGHEIEINGVKVSPEDVLEEKKGVKIVYAVDTRPVFHEFMKNADVLIHDSTFLERDKTHGIEKKHSTAREAGIVAREVGAKNLFLVHVSGRYKNDEEVEAEAREVFKNAVLPKDGYCFLL